jgi:hypothetical protein
VGLALSRSLGFTVIGRLAARFGIVVRLTSSPAGGVSALVTLPANLVNAEPYVPEHGDWQPAAGHPAPTGPTPRVALEAPPAPFRPEPVDVAHLPLANLPLAGALDEGAARTGRDLSDFDGERATAGAADDETSDVSGTGASTLPPPPPPPAPFEPTWRPAAPTQPAPSVPARTAATAPPLPTRKPRTADTAPDADSPVTAAGLTRRVPKSVGGASASPNLTGNAPVAATTRSPEEVRLMLSRYRSGLRRGRGEDAGNGHEDS